MASGTDSPAAGAGAGATAPATAPERPEVQTSLRLKGKVVVVGEIAVGKTSIVSKFTTGEFNKNERPSIGVAFSQKSVNVEHHSVKFEVWDTAGQERFRSVNSLYYRGAGAGVIVYDVTNRHSFENLQKHWLRELRENTSSDLVVAIVGNKCDLESSRRVTTEEAAKFAQENNFLFLETSAKTGKNVDAVFVAIARQALKQCSKNLEDGTDPPAAGTAPTSGRSSAGNGFTIVGVDRNPVRLDRQESTKSSGCC